MWEYIDTVEVSKDTADKWRARIRCQRDGTEECFFIKFQTYPSLTDIETAANTLIEGMNAE